MAQQERSSNLNAALENIRRSASGKSIQGLMLAFTDERGTGFSFLACHSKLRAILYAIPINAAIFPSFTCTFQGGPDGKGLFIQAYLEMTARYMKIDYGQLVTHFSRRRMPWRFEAWENGVLATAAGDMNAWRTRLRPIISRLEAAPPRCLSTQPGLVHKTILTQLQAHASDGLMVHEQ